MDTMAVAHLVVASSHLLEEEELHIRKINSLKAVTVSVDMAARDLFGETVATTELVVAAESKFTMIIVMLLDSI